MFPTFINLPLELAQKLGWSQLDAWISSNRSHFDSKDGKKLTPIVELEKL
jgi:hypothetical protein